MPPRPPSPGCPGRGAPVSPLVRSNVSLTLDPSPLSSPRCRSRCPTPGGADLDRPALPGANHSSGARRPDRLVNGPRWPREVRLGGGSALVPAVLSELADVVRGKHGQV